MSRLILVAPRQGAEVLAAELSDVRRATGLRSDELEHRVIEHGRSVLSSDDVARGIDGIIVGGSPLCVTSPNEDAWQCHVNHELKAVCDSGLPVFFICFGAGFVADLFGGRVGRTHPEVSGSSLVELTPEAAQDPVFRSLPKHFEALTGHTENVVALPEFGTLLASGPTCPVQALRVGDRIWATQFHPDLDHPGMINRMTAYRDHGYFPAEAFDEIIADIAGVDTSPAQAVLRNFVSHVRSLPNAA